MKEAKDNKPFDQREYVNNYKKTHYKNIQIAISEKDKNIISDYCNDMKISQTKFLTAAAKYCIDNAVDIDELLSHL